MKITKKIIIKDSNQEVEFYDDDTLAIYIPDNNGKVVRELKFEDSECYDSVVIFKNNIKFNNAGWICISNNCRY